jgi:hypothetical protein
VKKHIAQYLNEIVSITIMLLMAIALVAGPATHGSIGADEAADRVPYQAVRTAGDD